MKDSQANQPDEDIEGSYCAISIRKGPFMTTQEDRVST